MPKTNEEDFPVDLSSCPHCFSGTHTLKDGSCGKCGGAKAIPATGASEFPPDDIINQETIEAMVRDFTQVQPRSKSEVRERILKILAIKDAECEERVREAVTRFREMIWSSATPDFRSTKGGEDCYILKKKDLNNITYLLFPPSLPHYQTN